MEKNIKLAQLLDLYKPLLTEKQADALSLYYDMDLSLAEIAESVGITRQGVREFIKKGESHLYDFEQKLHLLKSSEHIKKTVDDIKKITDDAYIADKLDSILDCLG